MNTTVFFFAVGLFWTGFVAEAKECYICSRLEDGNGTLLQGDRTCVSRGRKPEDGLIKVCNLSGASTYDLGVVPELSARVASLTADLDKASGNDGSRNPSNSEVGCFKIIHEGSRLNMSGRYKFINRGCFKQSTNPAPEKECKTQSLSEWSKGNTSLWSRFVINLADLRGFTPDAQVTACSCTKDKCNTSALVTGSISSVFFVGIVLKMFLNHGV